MLETPQQRKTRLIYEKAAKSAARWEENKRLYPRRISEQQKLDRVKARQIEELENLKRGYVSKANRLDDQAERLQFEDNSFLESRRFSELAQENRDKAQRTQDEIDRLTLEKQQLMKGRK